jgi:hypothetical protein
VKKLGRINGVDEKTGAGSILENVYVEKVRSF